MNQKGFIKFILILIILLAGIVWTFFMLNSKLPKSPRQLACTPETEQCPDGSYVSRTGPNCEFAKCPNK